MQNDPTTAPGICPRCKSPLKFQDEGALYCPSCKLTSEEWEIERDAQLAKITAALHSAWRKALPTGGLEQFNATLKAAGLSLDDEDYFLKLWAIARVDLGLSDKEFLQLTPKALNALVERKNALRPSPPEKTAVQKARPADQVKRIHELFKEEHRQALALEIVMNQHEDLANEEIFDLLDQKSATPPPGYKSWNEFHRKGGRSPHDMVTKVKSTLREHGLLITIQ